MKPVDYEWNLRELMSDAGMFATTQLRRELQERGVTLSTSQVYRLVTEKPERLNLKVMVALTDIFDCTADDLIQRVASQEATLRTGTDSSENAASSDFLRTENLRPKRAQVAPDHES